MAWITVATIIATMGAGTLLIYGILGKTNSRLKLKIAIPNVGKSEYGKDWIIAHNFSWKWAI